MITGGGAAIEHGSADLEYGTHSMRRTKATLIYRRTKNLRAVRLLLGHSEVESTVRHLGIEVDDALGSRSRPRSEPRRAARQGTAGWPHLGNARRRSSRVALTDDSLLSCRRTRSRPRRVARDLASDERFRLSAVARVVYVERRLLPRPDVEFGEGRCQRQRGTDARGRGRGEQGSDCLQRQRR